MIIHFYKGLNFLLFVCLKAPQGTEKGKFYYGQSDILFQCIWKFHEWL